MGWIFRAIRFVARVTVVSAVVSLVLTAVARRLGLAPAVAAIVI